MTLPEHCESCGELIQDCQCYNEEFYDDYNDDDPEELDDSEEVQ